MPDLYGNINLPESCQEDLETLGVKVGKWCTKDGRFEKCRIPERAVEHVKSYLTARHGSMQVRDVKPK